MELMNFMNEIGITERGDATLDNGWFEWVRDKKPAILITKDPFKLNEILASFISHSNIVVHATITGFGGTVLEPYVPEYKKSLEGYNSLIKILGEERVVLRVDPVIPTEKGLETAKNVMKELNYTRARISFIDYYDHVKRRFAAEDISLPWDTFHAPLDLRKKAWKELGEPEVCGEPGFECCGCVSGMDCQILGVQPIQKEKGQRFQCACLANKRELLTSRKQCSHQCLYCYWRG
jgi:DNA repair photolyase